MLVCVNLDPQAAQEGLVTVPDFLGLGSSFSATDALTGKRFSWKTGDNYVGLAPGQSHVLRVSDLPV